MYTRVAIATLAIVLSTGGAFAADNPFIGRWKLNPSMSQMTGRTVTYEQMPLGHIRYLGEGMSYTFKTDGHEYEAPLGRKVVWKQIDERNWTATTTQGGQLLVTADTSLSPDGKTMTVVYKGTKPNGEAFQDTVVYERISGASGLIGKWRSKDVKIGSPSTFAFEPNGEDGMTLRIIDLNAACAAKFDGKDYPATGPTVPPNFTLAIERKGQRSFAMTQKQNGKPIYRSAFTVSADGRTMTSEGAPVGVNEVTRAVYDKQ